MKTIITLTLWLTLLAGMTVHSAILTGNTNSITLLVTENVTASGGVSVSAKTGPLAFSGGTYDIGPTGVTLTNAITQLGSIAPFVPKPVTTSNVFMAACNNTPLPATASQAVAQAISYLESPTTQASLLQPLQAYMKTYGIPSATFIYQQQITVAQNVMNAATSSTDIDRYCYSRECGDNWLAIFNYYSAGGSGGYSCNPSAVTQSTQSLFWTFTLDQSGKVSYPDPVILPSSSLTTYVMYTSLASDPTIPANMVPVNAGFLSYVQLDSHMNPVGAMTNLNVQGAYDVPYNASSSSTQESANSVGLVDAAAACVGNNLSIGCPPTQHAYPDAKSLIDSTGTNIGLLDYVESVGPTYYSIGLAASDSTGATDTVVPGMILQEQSRTLTFPPCGFATYETQGSYQLSITTTIDRYLVTTLGVTTRINQWTSSQQTAAVPFNLTTTGLGPTGTYNWNNIGTFIIDPIPPSTDYLPWAGLPSSILPAPPPDVVTIGVEPTSTYYSYGNNQICDVDNQQTISGSCTPGYTLSMDSTTLQYSCSATPESGNTCSDGTIATNGICSTPPVITNQSW